MMFLDIFKKKFNFFLHRVKTFVLRLNTLQDSLESQNVTITEKKCRSNWNERIIQQHDDWEFTSQQELSLEILKTSDGKTVEAQDKYCE